MKVLIFGLGSIGSRHARLLKGMGEHDLYAFRSQRQVPCNDLGIPEIFSWDEVGQVSPEVAFITNPTSLHISTALSCAERGMSLFVEKTKSSWLRQVI